MNIIATSKLIIVIGLGMTGLSVARYLHKNEQRFVVLDSREIPPNLELFQKEFPDTPLHLGRLDETLLCRASEIVISPGMSLKTPELQCAIAAGIPIIGDIELFARAVTQPVIAITGSNAKSTVTTLVGEMAESCGLTPAVGGNVGVPVLDLLENTSVDIFVLELSSFQLETTRSLKPVAATVLNVSLDHMDRYASLAEYHQVKQRIYRHAKSVVINRQDVLTQPPLAKEATVISFGSDSSDMRSFGLLQQQDETFLSYKFAPLLSTDDMQIKGRHNHVNALAALALGVAAGFDMQGMLAALKTFNGLPHRCEFIATINDVSYINDSKATNVGATLAAIEGFSLKARTNRAGEHGASKNIVLIAGGDGKDADFLPLVNAVKHSVKTVVLIGQDAEKLYDVLHHVVPCVKVDSLIEAVKQASNSTEKNDVVLLSPACASFDMFSGFEDRGRQFSVAVQALVA
jgi:UDP-N-acetylmuramoylalanine--D-glutamate ligase